MPQIPSAAGPRGLSPEEVDQALSAAFGDPSACAVPNDSVLHQLGDAVADTPPLILRPAGGQSAEPLPSPIGSAGRFELLGELGRGGLGVVMRGRDVDLGREVAMKVLHDRHAGDPGMVQKLVAEAQVGGQLQHPGIVPVYEMGIDPDGRPFFAMKLVEGQTLAVLLRRRQRPGDERDALLSMFVQVCQALGYAHARGVVHRDVKPSNVMVGAFGEVQVVDWGLAKVLDGPSPPMQVIAGTPAYMAPEQARGEDEHVDARSDVFGLGAILCEILTGRAPFRGGSSEETRHAAAAGQLDEALRALAECGADVELIALAGRCLDPEPSRRPADGGEVAKAVAEHLASVSMRARMAEVQLARAETKAAEERRRRRLVAGLAATVLVAMSLAVGGYLWYAAERNGRRERAEARVQQALERAQGELGAAQAGTAGQVAAWQRAEAAAREALALAEAEVGPEVRSRAAAVFASARDGGMAAQAAAAQTAHETAVRERLCTIREERGDDWYDKAARPDAAYADVFREVGVDVDALDPAEAARRIRGSPLAETLMSALLDWIRALLPKDVDSSRDVSRLGIIARAAETDPVRRQLCDSWFDDDLAPLQRLAASSERPGWPPATLCMLGHELHRHGDDSTAVQVLAEGYRAHPDDLWLGVELAQLVPRDTAKGRHERLRLLSAVVALRPQSPRFRIDLAHAYVDDGDADAARIEIDAAIRLRPEGPEAYNELGNLLMTSRCYAEAEAVLREGLRYGSNAYILTTMGGVLQQLGRNEEALAMLEEARAQKPELVGMLSNFGPVLRALGRVDEAEACLRKAIALRPGLAAPHLNLGVLLENKGDASGARREYEEAVRLDPGSVLAWFDLGQLLDQQQAFEDAAAALLHAVELAPANLAYRFLCGHALFNCNRLDDALPQLRAAEADPPHDRHQPLLLMIADCLSQRGETAAALGYAEQALATEPRHPDTCFDLGRLFARNGRGEDAIAAFRHARELGDETAASAVAQCEHVLALADDFKAVLAGDHQASSPDELVNVARIVWRRGELPAAATMVHEVMALQGARAKAETLLLAAEIGVRAGFGSPEAMPENDDAAAWRGKAITWLRWALDAEKARIGTVSGTQRRYFLAGLTGWRRLPQFAVLRDNDRLTRFTEAERREVLAFWMDHAAAIDTAK